MSENIASAAGAAHANAIATDSETPLSEQAYRLLRKDILHGRVAPGEKLKLEVLQSRYGFSNTPLREALNRLAAEELVISDERRGFRASPVSLNDFWDLTEYRLVIEQAAFTDAIRNGTDDWETGIVAAFHRMEIMQGRAGRDRKSLNDEWTRRHKGFHLALIATCRSLRLRAACSAMFDHAERYRRLSALHRKDPRDARREHRALMELALERKQSAAAALLRGHISKTAERVTKIMKNAGSLPARER
jgi:GntR family carbon starvation induced transcriptional regulator